MAVTIAFMGGGHDFAESTELSSVLVAESALRALGYVHQWGMSWQKPTGRKALVKVHGLRAGINSNVSLRKVGV